MTVTPEASDQAWFDLGATWHWADQERVRGLATELGLTAFPQLDAGRALHEAADGSPPTPVELAPQPSATLRFVGGTQALCHRLVDRLAPASVSLGRAVTAVVDRGPRLAAETVAPDGTRATLESGSVVVTLPPRLALQSITFTPALPDPLVEVMRATPTWMGEAIKCVAVYDSPFWRAAGLSGSAFSDRGPLHEVHDASTHDGTAAGLWGFVALDPDHRSMQAAQRVPLVLEQLGRLFGPEAADPVQYLERDWSGDPYTCEEEHSHAPPLDYGHPAFADRALYGGRLLWAGTETAEQGGGHMEGAVRSGQRAARLVLEAG